MYFYVLFTGEEGVGGGRGEKKREGERGKKFALAARAAPKREEGDKGGRGEVRGGRGERPTPCPSPHTSW